MKNYFVIICVILFTIHFSFSQVGIGTDTPKTTLDVNGVVRISSIPVATGSETATSFTGLTADNNFNKSELGANLVINQSGELITSPGNRKINSFELGRVTPDVDDGVNPVIIYNLDLLLQHPENTANPEILPDPENEYTTYINISDYTIGTKIVGLAGGTHGRKLTLYNNINNGSGISLTIYESGGYNYADPTNRMEKNEILTGSSSGRVIGPKGIVELVYDQYAMGTGPNAGRWLLLKFRN